MEFRFQDYLTRPHRLVAMRRFMAQTATWSADRLLAWQMERLRAMARHARDHVPYYRHAFAEAGFEAEDLKDLSDWSALPPLPKSSVREHLRGLQANNAINYRPVWARTSGSTGTAMRFMLDQQVNLAAFCVLWRHWDQCPDWRIGRRQLVVANIGDPSVTYRWKTRILAFPATQLRLEGVPSLSAAIHRYRPRMLRGYPSALSELASLFERAGQRVSFNGIVTHSETLLQHQREQIERAFSGTILDHYTHWERAASIGQCRSGSYHAHGDYGYHEIVREDGSPAGPDETGRIVVTGLHNHAMPLLRYETLDLGAWAREPCRCGSPFPTVDRIEGRLDDLVVTPDGRRIGRLSTVFLETPRVQLAQIVQETRAAIRVLLVTDSDYGQEDERHLVRELRGRLGDTIRIDIQYQGDIPRGPGGKRRLVVSRLGSAHGRPP